MAQATDVKTVGVYVEGNTMPVAHMYMNTDVDADFVYVKRNGEVVMK